jgi:KDO2-lipid IV(A) lauroyltransferase
MNKLFKSIVVRLIFVVAKFPLWVLYVFADILFFLMFYVVRYRRKVVYDNLKGSFPEKQEKEIRSITKMFYRHFCDLIIESVKNIGDSRKLVIKRMHFKNPELLDEIYQNGKSIILYTGHYGNWEWFTVLPALFKFKAIALYQPFSDSITDNLMKRSRERYGLQAIPSTHAYKALKKYSDENIQTITLVLGDQSPPANGSMVWLPFLNRETAFIVGAGKIARKLDQVVVFPHFRKISRGNYEIEMIRLDPEADAKSDNPYIRGYAKQLEKSIQADPSLWLWSHRRWKLTPNNEE